MPTSNVNTTSPGTSPFNVDVTAANLLADLQIKDFQVFVNGVFTCEGSACTDWTKTTSTLLTYSGTPISSGAPIQIRRKTPNVVIQLVGFAERFSSGLWNSELDRIIRWREEADLNGTGPGTTITVATPNDTAYPTGWDGDIISPPTRNAVYDALQLFALLASPGFTGTPTAPTASDGTNNTQIATTAFAHTRVSNALASSPTLGGNPTATTQAANNDTTRIATTAFVQQELRNVVAGTSTVTGVWDGVYKNAVMNSRFDIWQRAFTITVGASGSFQSGYSADRWRYAVDPNGGTSGAFNIIRGGFSPGSTEVASNPTFMMRITNSGTGASLGNSSYHLITQPIENVYTYSGQQVTLSFWARSTISSKVLGFSCTQFFGTGGSPSADVNAIGATTFTLSNTWTKYTHTFTVPSITGKTIGTNGVITSFLDFRFWLQTGSTTGTTHGVGAINWGGTGDTEVTQIQLERGGTATNYDIRDPVVEYLKCRRYFQTSFPIGQVGVGTNDGILTFFRGGTTANNMGCTAQFIPHMRVVPSIVVYDDAGNINRCFKGGSNKNTTVYVSGTGAVTVLSNDATTTDDFRFNYTASAEF